MFLFVQSIHLNCLQTEAHGIPMNMLYEQQFYTSHRNIKSTKNLKQRTAWRVLTMKWEQKNKSWLPTTKKKKKKTTDKQITSTSIIYITHKHSTPKIDRKRLFFSHFENGDWMLPSSLSAPDTAAEFSNHYFICIK